jgi:hypothetical protein
LLSRLEDHRRRSGHEAVSGKVGRRRRRVLVTITAVASATDHLGVRRTVPGVSGNQGFAAFNPRTSSVLVTTHLGPRRMAIFGEAP